MQWMPTLRHHVGTWVAVLVQTSTPSTVTFSQVAISISHAGSRGRVCDLDAPSCARRPRLAVVDWPSSTGRRFSTGQRPRLDLWPFGRAQSHCAHRFPALLRCASEQGLIGYLGKICATTATVPRNSRPHNHHDPIRRLIRGRPQRLGGISPVLPDAVFNLGT